MTDDGRYRRRSVAAGVVLDSPLRKGYSRTSMGGSAIWENVAGRNGMSTCVKPLDPLGFSQAGWPWQRCHDSPRAQATLEQSSRRGLSCPWAPTDQQEDQL
jgi:hypothetical protein